MRTVLTSVPALSISDQPPLAVAHSPGRRRLMMSWRNTGMMVKMGVAFLFPWPFGTNGLKADVADRALRIHSSSWLRAGKLK